MSFGKKGLNASQARQGRRSAAGFGAASSQPTKQADPYAAQREAFLSEERVRREVDAPATPIDFSQPAHTAQHAPFVSGYVGERSDLRSKVEDWTDNKFGLPHQRRTMMAYFLLFMLAPVSMHRFYCGEFTKGMAQVGLFGGGLIFLVIFPPIGLAMLAFRGFWVLFDFLMIPGMLQRLKDRSGSGRSVML